MGWFAENFPHTTASTRRFWSLLMEMRRYAKEQAILERISEAHDTIWRGYEELARIRAERKRAASEDPAP